jgi:hypothetical protein
VSYFNFMSNEGRPVIAALLPAGDPEAAVPAQGAASAAAARAAL